MRNHQRRYSTKYKRECGKGQKKKNGRKNLEDGPLDGIV